MMLDVSIWDGWMGERFPVPSDKNMPVLFVGCAPQFRGI